MLRVPTARVVPTITLRAPQALARLLPALCLALLVLLVAACGNGATPTPLGTQPIDANSMKQLLTLQDIQRAGGDTSHLNIKVEDVETAAATLNPSQTQNVLAWYVMKVERGSSSTALLFTLIEFNNASGASNRLSQIEGGLGFKPMNPPVANASALLSSSAETGLTFIKGSRMVTLQTTGSDLSQPILDQAGIERLARVIAGRL